ncbi:O-antigen ligase family protein [Providencia huaxiensis]|uniref:O-antigen ligase family protein n=1 Tax=Providencia huaxiensis TaxID=2027290 RepID=UPI000C7EFFF1|nr:O-antigen ligase family protein [Providencia huaxiensis]AXH63488.1 O-antigen ligase family protein [Providencia huaxiensis]
MKNNSYAVAQLPFLLLSLVILGMFTNDTQGVLNVSAVILLLYTIYTAVKNKINPWHDILTIVKTRKTLFLFGAWGLFCALFFTYADFTLAALKVFFNDWRYVVIISLFLVVFKSTTQKSSKTITYALICTLAFTLFVIPILKQFKDSDLPLYLQLRFGFAHYMTLLFPFTFSALFLFKQKSLKIVMLLLSLLAFIFLLYTGSRGGVLSVVIESIIILLLLSKSYKRLLISMISFGALASIILTATYLTIPQVKNKINQSLYSENITSKRDKIIETRYPIFMNSISNQLVGIGYGSVAYNQFLLDNNAPKNQGGMGYSQKRKTYHYNNDEPFFLNITYNIGFIGLALFLIAFFINMKDLFKDIRIEKNILNVGIFVSSIGYFLVYCLFEFIFIDIFILYNILTAILIKKVLSR